jgi:hypothetical protein
MAEVINQSGAARELSGAFARKAASTLSGSAMLLHWRQLCLSDYNPKKNSPKKAKAANRGFRVAAMGSQDIVEATPT